MTAAATATMQHGFAAALLAPAQPLPPGLTAWNGSDPARRFAVHRNNVVVSLVEALGQAFPVVRRLVGETFFAAMARHFVIAQPPASPVLAEYGEGLADWIAGFPPAAALPYLADMARLERARVRAFHAADAPALPTTHLAARLADPERLAQARPALHPSCSVVTSRFAVAALWAAHQVEGEIPSVTIDAPQAALVLRDPREDVLVIAVVPMAARFYRALVDGATLGQALDAATSADDPQGFDLADALSLLIRHGALVAWPSSTGVDP